MKREVVLEAGGGVHVDVERRTNKELRQEKITLPVQCDKQGEIVTMLQRDRQGRDIRHAVRKLLDFIIKHTYNAYFPSK